MKLETFFNKFDELGDTPEGVKSMRELVLRLAFSGGLTGKRPTDDGVPEGWESRTIESISASISSGFACSRSHQVENGHVHLRTHNISTLGTLNFDLLVRIDPKMVDPQKASIRAGDILFNNTNSQELVGKTSLVDRDYDYGFSNHITRIRLKDGIFPGFVVFYLTLLRNSGYFARLCTRWINQAAVNTDTLKEQTIPIPPLAEQKRIVAKVDELMALCDRLEAQQQERETRHVGLARASLARFAEAPTPANLNFLFHDSYTIDSVGLRKAILALAIKGKLVHQDWRDGSAKTEVAGTLLKSRADRNIQKEDEIGVSNMIAPSIEPWAAPDSWVWVGLSSACHTITDGEHLTPAYSPEGVPMLSAKHIGTRKLIWDDFKYVSSVVAEKCWSRCKPEIGDILVVSRGGGVGRTIVSDRDGYCLMGSVLLFKTYSNVFSEYLNLYLNSEYGNEKLRTTSGASAQQAIYIVHLRRDYIFPLPPLAEQRRIVAKADQLMALVDKLETQLTESRATAANLFSALVAELTCTSNNGKVSVPSASVTGRRGRPPKS
jgi:type I restriction enzyme, S subunit